eukprot:1785949-Pleurochrysis_carterae.AAC.1
MRQLPVTTRRSVALYAWRGNGSGGSFACARCVQRGQTSAGGDVRACASASGKSRASSTIAKNSASVAPSPAS